jgi:hypothetical protein
MVRRCKQGGREGDHRENRASYTSRQNSGLRGSWHHGLLPKPITSGITAKGRFGKQDFVYVAEDDFYLCPAGEQLTYHYTNEEAGKTLHRYWVKRAH